MKKLTTLLLIVCHIGLLKANSQFSYASYNPRTTTGKSYFRLGDKLIVLARHGDIQEQPYVLVSLHSNERTASAAAQKFVSDHGGLFIQLHNNNQKYISFNLYNKQVVLDPEKIFTAKGRWHTIDFQGKKDQVMANRVNEFANFMVQEIPDGKAIISLHNNSDGEYGISAYKKGSYSKDAKSVYINPEMDVDDFIITTNKKVYEQLKDRKINVVLQAHTARDDGSLGVYCSKVKRPFFNIESQNDHPEEQLRMIKAVTDILKQ